MRQLGFAIIALAFLAACATVEKPSQTNVVGASQARIEELEADKEAFLKAAQEKSIENVRLEARIDELEAKIRELEQENAEIRNRLLGRSTAPSLNRPRTLYRGYTPEKDEPRTMIDPASGALRGDTP